jgi:hypothetical protein
MKGEPRRSGFCLVRRLVHGPARESTVSDAALPFQCMLIREHRLIQTGAAAYSTREQKFPKKAAVSGTRGAMGPWQARCIQGYVSVHLHATIRMRDLARVVNFGPFRLKRTFIIPSQQSVPQNCRDTPGSMAPDPHGAALTNAKGEMYYEMGNPTGD